MVQIKAKIISNERVAAGYFKMALDTARIARESIPGQFVHIRVNDGYQPLLRRPFSIHRYQKPNTIEILYEVVGKGTQILSQKKDGEYIDVIGPLGNGFNYQLQVTNQRAPILVGGGMGIAPLTFLAEKLAEIKRPAIAGAPKSKIKILVLIGASTADEILCKKEFKDLGCVVKISTDDGSRGFKGKVTDLLKNLLSTVSCQLSTIYACGPKPMLKIIAALSGRYKIPCQVSLDEYIACGVGACLGCAIKIKNQKSKIKNDFKYKLVCKDGPVFNIEDIVWE